MSGIPWRMHPSFILTCVFHSLLFGSVGFLHLCIWQTTHSTLICSLTLPFVRTRHVFKSSDTNLHRHSFSFNPSFHLWPLTCSLSSLVSFTSYLISAFWNSAFQILGRKVFWIPRNVHLVVWFLFSSDFTRRISVLTGSNIAADEFSFPLYIWHLPQVRIIFQAKDYAWKKTHKEAVFKVKLYSNTILLYTSLLLSN